MSQMLIPITLSYDGEQVKEQVEKVTSGQVKSKKRKFHRIQETKGKYQRMARVFNKLSIGNHPFE